MNLYSCLKKMMPVAESIGDITEVGMDYEWIKDHDRIVISGETNSGRKFELKLDIEIKKEEQDGN